MTSLPKQSFWNNFSRTFHSVDKLTIFYTLVVFLTNFGFGITVNIFGATMIDISRVYDVPMNLVTQMVTANSVGYMIGTLAGWIYRWADRVLVNVVFLVILSVTTIFAPYFTPPWLAFGATILNGIAQGVYGSSGPKWLIDLWPTVGTAFVLQCGQFLYGLGTISAPLLSQNFVYGEANYTIDGQELTIDLRRKLITIPYAVNGIIQIIPAILFLILYFVSRNQKHSETVTEITVEKAKSQDNLEETPREVSFRKIKLALCGLCLACYFTGETGYFPYTTSMLQYMEIHLPAWEANKVTSVLSATYTICPLVTALISLKLKPDYIIAGHYGIIMTGIAVLYFGRLNKTLIYVGSGILGYGFSPMTPSIFAFTQRHLGLSDRVTSIFSFMAGSLGLVIPIIIGPFIQQYPLILLYLLAIFVGLSCVMYSTIKGWISVSKK